MKLLGNPNPSFDGSLTTAAIAKATAAIAKAKAEAEAKAKAEAEAKAKAEAEAKAKAEAGQGVPRCLGSEGVGSHWCLPISNANGWQQLQWRRASWGRGEGQG